MTKFYLKENNILVDLEDPNWVLYLTIKDVARNLSQVNRSIGVNEEGYTVLNHCYDLSNYIGILRQFYPEKYTAKDELFMLLHDCEKAIFGEIPTGPKEFLGAEACNKMKNIRYQSINHLTKNIFYGEEKDYEMKLKVFDKGIWGLEIQDTPLLLEYLVSQKGEVSSEYERIKNISTYTPLHTQESRTVKSKFVTKYYKLLNEVLGEEELF